MTVREYMNKKIDNWIDYDVDDLVFIVNNNKTLCHCLVSEYVNQFKSFEDCEIGMIDVHSDFDEVHLK